MSSVAAVKQEVATKRLTTVFDFMDQKKDIIAKALPNHITVDRLVGMFTIVIRSNPELMNCSQASLIGAMVQTAQLGLMPGNINHCYYVPFNNKKKDGSVVREVQFILGYRGMIELVNRSGKAAILATECVYEKDEFNYSLGLEPRLEHRPADGDRGDVIGVYCVAKNLIVNERLFVYLTRQEINKVRSASKAGQSEYSPWAKWFEEMCKKTAIKRMHKLLPLSIDIQKKLAADETIKSRIEPDMSAVHDETNWEEGQVVEAQKIETPESKPELARLDKNLQAQLDQLRKKVGEERFMTVLGNNGFESVEELQDMEAVKVISDLTKTARAMEE